MAEEGRWKRTWRGKDMEGRRKKEDIGQSEGLIPLSTCTMAPWARGLYEWKVVRQPLSKLLSQGVGPNEMEVGQSPSGGSHWREEPRKYQAFPHRIKSDRVPSTTSVANPNITKALGGLGDSNTVRHQGFTEPPSWGSVAWSKSTKVAGVSICIWVGDALIIRGYRLMTITTFRQKEQLGRGRKWRMRLQMWSQV